MRIMDKKLKKRLMFLIKNAWHFHVTGLAPIRDHLRKDVDIHREEINQAPTGFAGIARFMDVQMKYARPGAKKELRLMECRVIRKIYDYAKLLPGKGRTNTKDIYAVHEVYRDGHKKIFS